MGQETVLSALLERRSIRAFKPIPVEQDIVDQLELAAQRAPSSEFLNDWSTIRVTDPQKKEELARIGNQPYIAQAPLLYVFVLDQYRNARIAEAQRALPSIRTIIHCVPAIVSFRLRMTQFSPYMRWRLLQTRLDWVPWCSVRF